MKRPRRSWWRTPLAILGWSFALGISYVVFADGNGNFPTGIYLVVGILAFNYAFNSLMEKLDAVLWKLEDIEQRLLGKYDSGPDELAYARDEIAQARIPSPIPGSIESYQQQFERPKTDATETDTYQRQFWKK
jgi:hypothetical protein